MTERKYTESQQKAINESGTLLVSAGAGSGKTTVLIERIATLIKKEKTPVSDFLIVTFTNAAAAEMKTRLAEKLEQDSAGDSFSKAQILEIASSDIGTLHSFCFKFLKSNFYEAGLDPAFGLLDEIEAKNLKNKAADELIRRKTSENDNDFFELADIFMQNRKDESFKAVILKLHEFSGAISDYDEWFEKIVNEVYAGEFCEKELSKHASSRAGRLREKIEKLLFESQKEKNGKYIEILNQLDLNLMKFREENTFLQNINAAKSFEQASKVMKKENQEELAEKIKGVKKEVKTLFEEFEQFFGYIDTEAAKQRTLEAKRRVENLNKLMKDFKSIYADEKAAQMMLDFSDLEKMTQNLLKNPEIRKKTQEKYKYIFIDEYQDTNPVQEEIIKAISKNNLFMVGDVKQSIYGFRLSEPQIFIDKQKRFEVGQEGQNVYLNDNFRSNPEILDFINQVFSKVMTPEFGGIDYAKTSMLKSGGEEWKKTENDFPAVKVQLIKKAKRTKTSEEELPPLEVYSVLEHENKQTETIASATAEGQVVLRVLRELKDKQIFDRKLGKVRALKPEDIAILTATRGDYLKTLTNVLEQNGFSVSLDMTSDIFEDVGFLQLKSLLQVIDNSKQDYPLICTMKSFFFDFSDEELAQVKIFSKNSKHFHEAVEELKSAELTSKNIKKNQEKLKIIQEKTQKMYEFFEKYSFISTYSTVSDLILKLVNDTDFENYLLLQNDGDLKKAKLERLVALLEGKAFNQSLPKFLNALEEIELGFDNSGFLADSGGAVFDESAAEIEFLGSMSGIRVTTIHKSKGLEFPVVILVGAGRPFNFEDLNSDFIVDRNVGIGISSFDLMERTKTNNPVLDLCKINQKKKKLEEHLRLFYVALTRAINHLIVVGVGEPDSFENSIKDIFSSTCFFDFLTHLFESESKGFSVAKDSMEMLAKQPVDEIKYEVGFGNPDPKLLEEINSRFSFVYPFEESTVLAKKYSVSEIVHSEADGQVFEKLFEGSSTEKGAEKGTAYHKLMQHINFACRTPLEIRQTIDELVELGEIDEAAAKLIDVNEISECLENPIMKLLAENKKEFAREKEFLLYARHKDLFGGKVEDKVLVQGVVDLVIFDKGEITIVDYKTNVAKNVEELKKKYERQLNIYAKAMEESFGFPVKNKVIYSFSLGQIARI